VARLNPLFDNPILFASREFDAETGLYYHRARYLAPTTGRWTTPDPLGFAAGDANLYRYVGNRATLAIDPSGYLEQPSWWVGFVNSWDAVLGDRHTGWFAQASNFGAGMGDTVSFGATRRFRQWVGYDDVVDYTSTAYHVGNYAGTAVQIGFVWMPYGWVYFAVGSPLIVWNAVEGVPAYRALGVDLGPAVVIGIASHLPILNSVVSVVEFWNGVSLRPGQGFGQPLDGWGYADRVVGLALDAVIVGRVGYSMTRPRPQTPAAPNSPTAAPTTAADRIASRTMTRAEWQEFYRTLRTEARNGAKAIGNPPARQRGPVLSAVIDARTGQTFSANNTLTVAENLHPVLRSRLETLLQTTDLAALRGNAGNLGRWVHSTPGAHAEINALNQALWARQNAGLPTNLNEFWMVNRWLTKTAPPAPRCGYCRQLTQGVNVLTD
jgi:RHS repeat-associated protein